MFGELVLPNMGLPRRRADSEIIWWLRVIFQLGVPSAIGVFLVWRLSTGLPTAADVIDVKALLNAHVLAAETQSTEVRMLLRAICYNTAKDETQSRACGAIAK